MPITAHESSLCLRDAGASSTQMDGATVWLDVDGVKAASLAAPVGWAFDERWRKFVNFKWRALCVATGCGSGESLAHTGQRAVAAAIAFTFWPECFSKQVDAARAFGAPVRLLSRRLPAVRTFINGETPESFAIPPNPSTPYPDGLATPQLTLPLATTPTGADTVAANWQRVKDMHADNQWRRRKRVRAAADAGDTQANAIMDAEVARGKKRRKAADDDWVKNDGRKVLAERERQRKSKDFMRAAIGRRWAQQNPNPRKPRSNRSTAHPYGGRWGKSWA